VGISHNLGPVTANVAYGDWDDLITHFRAGIAKEFMGLNFTADYIDNDKTRANLVDPHNNKFVVVGVSKSF
jgi:glucose-6-phosphate isomerase